MPVTISALNGGAAPGRGESAAIRLVAFSAGDLAKAFAANQTKSEADFVRAVVAEGEPVASVPASSESATAHSTERRVEI
ncbi:hypothetical protein [Bradyrhizobium niftali]|uniref:hypothetical protein n=1 Tax=Bradyrhizobium niftali TaxID=2560055 RepID=UPI001ADDD407|nr:hypothetical protein [Bradyrhizobium niftali]